MTAGLLLLLLPLSLSELEKMWSEVTQMTSKQMELVNMRVCLYSHHSFELRAEAVTLVIPLNEKD